MSVDGEDFERLERQARAGDPDAAETLLRDAARRDDGDRFLKVWRPFPDVLWRRSMATEYAAFLERVEPGVRFVPAGRYVLGSPRTEPGRFDDEVQHEVELSTSLYARATPLTIGEWNAVTRGIGLSLYLTEHEIGLLSDKHPVTFVSWYSAVAWCNLLSVVQGLDPAYEISDPVGRPGGYAFSAKVQLRGLHTGGWRLPTEAEWEVLCRASDEPRTPLGERAWYKDNRPVTMPETGTRAANAWGLHDTLGLTPEWCWDAYAPYSLDPRRIRDPYVSSNDTGFRVGRGGAWLSEAFWCRPAARGYWSPGAVHPPLGQVQQPGFGFRPVRADLG